MKSNLCGFGFWDFSQKMDQIGYDVWPKTGQILWAILELHFHFTDMCALTDANFAVINLSTENGRTGSDE